MHHGQGCQLRCQFEHQLSVLLLACRLCLSPLAVLRVVPAVFCFLAAPGTQQSVKHPQGPNLGARHLSQSAAHLVFSCQNISMFQACLSIAITAHTQRVVLQFFAVAWE